MLWFSVGGIDVCLGEVVGGGEDLSNSQLLISLTLILLEGGGAGPLSLLETGGPADLNRLLYSLWSPPVQEVFCLRDGRLCPLGSNINACLRFSSTFASNPLSCPPRYTPYHHQNHTSSSSAGIHPHLPLSTEKIICRRKVHQLYTNYWLCFNRTINSERLVGCQINQCNTEFPRQIYNSFYLLTLTVT